MSVPFRLITPTRVVFSGDAELVIAVGTEGEEGILPRHAPFLTALKPGVLRANVIDGGVNSRLELATGEGFMQAFPERVTVLVDRALRFEDVDAAQSQEELAAATDRQRSSTTDPAAYAREQSIIDFANAKLRLTGHR
ncbi:MAG: ATP synthase F1 subunit epsilon [Candidatus Eremiobacteraeota bacterium]|nr:ATP synthase F1 subunit epsilon [Candidatus Eremiobacteraeota bacterium]